MLCHLHNTALTAFTLHFRSDDSAKVVGLFFAVAEEQGWVPASPAAYVKRLFTEFNPTT